MKKNNYEIFKKCYKTSFLQSFRGDKGLIRRKIKRSTGLETQKKRKSKEKNQKRRFVRCLNDFATKN